VRALHLVDARERLRCPRRAHQARAGIDVDMEMAAA